MLYELNKAQWVLDFNAPENKSLGQFLLFCENDILSGAHQKWQPLSYSQVESLALTLPEPLYLGAIDGVPWFAIVLTQDFSHSFVTFSVREAGKQNEIAFSMMSRAMQLFRWQTDHQFCGRCGRKTSFMKSERGAQCLQCKLIVYPRISPCVIVLVTKGDEVLLAKSVAHKDSPWYSTLAGFIEAGESAEQAVHREVFEEVGIKIHNLCYKNSQTWPYPHQLMLGYEAEYLSGNIVMQEEEIHDAKWWHIDALPQYSSAFSISGYLVEGFVKSRR